MDIVERLRAQRQFYHERPAIDHEKQIPQMAEISERECSDICASLGEAADTITSLRLRISELEGEWQPIETAPKDGSGVLVFSPDRCANCPKDTAGIAAVRWEDDAWCSGRLLNGDAVGLTHSPTHWRRLPPPPQSGDK